MYVFFCSMLSKDQTKREYHLVGQKLLLCKVVGRSLGGSICEVVHFSNKIEASGTSVPNSVPSHSFMRSFHMRKRAHLLGMAACDALLWQ